MSTRLPVTNHRTTPMLIGALLFATLGHQAQAATVHLAGQYFDYYYDDTQAGLAVLGDPQLSTSGNDLVFNSTGLFAQSTDGVGIHTGTATDVASLSFSFRAVARESGVSFSSLSTHLQGEYSLFSNQPGNAFVSMNGAVSVSDTLNITNTAFTNFNADTDFSLADGNLHPWEAIAYAGLEGDQWADVSDYLITMQYSLTAGSAGIGDEALVRETGAEHRLMFTMGAAVPLPGALWLFASAMVGVIGVVSMPTRSSIRTA